MSQTRVIAVEEHYSIERVLAHSRPVRRGGMAPDVRTRMLDLGEARLADMDLAGIDVQVLSLNSGGLQQLESGVAVSLARDANDQAAQAVAKHPGRLAAFAALPTANISAAVDELDRAVGKLGLKGAMINDAGCFLDHPSYLPILERAASLGVPLYIHPAHPPAAVVEAYYSGFDPAVNWALATSAWGSHAEMGLHSLRLILAGVFDRLPRLQVIIGHMGEVIPFMLARSDAALPPAVTKLERPLTEYFQNNFHITTSGFFTLPPFLNALLVMGADRIMFAIDYPFRANQVGRRFLDGLPLSLADRHKIAHGNAEKLLRL